MTLTKNDLNQIKQIVDSSIQTSIQANNKTLIKAFFKYVDEKVEPLATKEDISHLPTKEEFYKMEDKLMVEVKAEQEENAVISKQIERHEKRITKIERNFPIVSN